MDPNPAGYIIIISEIIFAAGGLFLSYRYFKYVQYLKNIPTAKIRSAPQGYVELTGKARPFSSTPYYVPGTGIPCVWFECVYDERQGSGSKPMMVTIETEQCFLIDDDTGTCRIDPPDIEIITKNSGGIPGRSGFTRWIGVGEEVHVFGVIETLHVNYRKQENELKRSRLKALKADRELMMKFDANNDGAIDIEEWESARKQVEQDVDNYIAEKHKQHKHKFVENVLRPPRDAYLPYLLSAYSELPVIRRYKLISSACFLVFLAIVAGTIVDFN